MVKNSDNFPYYADFLVRILNWMFPPLLKKSLEFYRWFYTVHEKPPVQLYTSGDLTEMAGTLEDPTGKDSHIDYLVEWLQHQPIADACGVRDAIERQIERAQQQPHKAPAAPYSAVDAVRDCLAELAREMKKKRRKNS